MKVNVFIFSVFTILEIKIKVSAIVVTVPKQCNEVYSKSTLQYVPYEETYQTRNWIGATKYKTRINYKRQYVITNHTREACCPGYTEYGTSCKPICSKNCSQNGYCVYPEHCACDHGYTMDYQVDKCKPICMDECVNGFCAAPNTCQCKDGYRMQPDNVTCSPICEHCGLFESCVEPHVCRCTEGYSRVPHSRLDSEKVDDCRPVCNRACVNGVCVAPNVCHCNDGYYGKFDGDEFTCYPRCSPNCVHGDCIAPNVCKCHKGFQLAENSTHICVPLCTKECVNGVCTAPDRCSCLDGYVAHSSEKHICEPFCPLGCEHGRCIAPETCACDDRYQPKQLASMCEPVCTEDCVMGKCIAPNTCKCNEGYKLANGSISECVPVCKDDCVRGVCTAPNECTCDDGYEMVNSTDGSSKCVAICECENGYCSETNSTCLYCAKGYDLLSDGNSTSCKPHCEGGCENGQCIEPETCQCDENYIREYNVVGNIVCVHVCGGDCVHGSCSRYHGRCRCLYGWVGEHCDEAALCSVTLSNSSNFLQFNSIFEESENITEDPWAWPKCNDLCTDAISNTTKCISQSIGEESIYVCFLDINSPCNEFSVVQANTSTAKVNYTILTTSIAILLIAITALIVGMFIRKKRLQKSAELENSNQLSQRAEEDNLIENENDGISL